MIVIIMLHEITVCWNGKIKANKRLSSFGDAARIMCTAQTKPQK